MHVKGIGIPVYYSYYSQNKINREEKKKSLYLKSKIPEKNNVAKKILPSEFVKIINSELQVFFRQ